MGLGFGGEVHGGVYSLNREEGVMQKTGQTDIDYYYQLLITKY